MATETPAEDSTSVVQTFLHTDIDSSCLWRSMAVYQRDQPNRVMLQTCKRCWKSNVIYGDKDLAYQIVGEFETDLVQARLEERDWSHSYRHCGPTALVAAAEDGHTSTVKKLLKAGANVNSWTSEGGTALTRAAFYGHTVVIQELLKANADVNHRTYYGRTALMEAAKHNHTSTVQELLEAGADINHQNKDGMTALMGAATEGHTYVMERLLEAGADVNHQDHWTRDALYIAVDNDHDLAVLILLNNGAENKAQALKRAKRRHGNDRLIKILTAAIATDDESCSLEIERATNVDGHSFPEYAVTCT